MTIEELIGALGGALAQGSLHTELLAVASAAQAGPGALLFAETPASAAEALASNAAAVVLKSVAGLALPADKVVIESDHPRLWFARAAKLLAVDDRSGRIASGAIVDGSAAIGKNVTVDATAVIGPKVAIGPGSWIGAGVVLGAGVRLGANCRIHPRVVIYPDAILGDRVVVHAGAVLGADGFGYVRDARTGAYTQFPQQGRLVIEDDVEIGANSTIDRGALAETRIGRGAKIDNLVHVGHNCQIGEDVILVALTGISGSSAVGNGAVLAGQVGVGDHARIGPGVILGGQAGVLSGQTLTNEGHKPGTVFWGTPVRPLKQALRESATLSRLAQKKSKENASE